MTRLESNYAFGEPMRALCADYAASRAPHALLLLGAPGVGKRTLARYLACALLCVSDTDRPCLACRGCKRAQSLTHPDLLTPSCGEKERSIKVEHLREIIRALSLRAGGNRVVLVENAQRMTPQAQNALLKSLEEPDADTYFILTASSEGGVLPTVRSRCRVLRVPPWPEKRVEETLLARGVAEARAKEAARLSGGSVGEAIRMADDEDFFTLRTLTVQAFFGLREQADVPEAAYSLREQKDASDAVLTLVSQRARSYLLFALGLAPSPEGAQNDAPGWLRASPQSLRRVLQTVLLMRKYRASNVNWQAAAERLLYTISEEIT